MPPNEFAVLTGTRSWIADPADYSSIVHLRFQPDGQCRLVFGYGQTVYADIHSVFQILEGRFIHFRYLPSPHKLTPAFNYEPKAILETSQLKYQVTEHPYTGKRTVTGKPFRYLRRLSFERSPFPPCSWFPFAPPLAFAGYEAEALESADGN